MMIQEAKREWTICGTSALCSGTGACSIFPATIRPQLSANTANATSNHTYRFGWCCAGASDYHLWAEDSLFRDIKVSVWMDIEPGYAQDMWTLLKIKSGKMERSPYMRELLFDVHYTLLYGGSEDLLTRLEQGFRDPVYPLSLGREDELLFVKDITVDSASSGESRFRGTILWRYPRNASSPNIAARDCFEPPLAERLPLSFLWTIREYAIQKTSHHCFLPLNWN